MEWNGISTKTPMMFFAKIEKFILKSYGIAKDPEWPKNTEKEQM